MWKEEGHMLFRPIQLREKMLESRPEDALVNCLDCGDCGDCGDCRDFVGQKTLHYNHQIHQNNLMLK